MILVNKSPGSGEAGAPADFSASRGGDTTPFYTLPTLIVKSDPTRLLDQALAGEMKAEALAAWHRERAARYLAWYDCEWSAGQYASHVREAQYQDALAARHRQVAAALQGVRHG